MIQLLLAIIYLAFISLGLPDSLLGSAWPTMMNEFEVPVSFAGGISMIISIGTIISSLLSDRVTKKIGTAKVTVFSALLTATALFGFSFSSSYWMLVLWAIPYGLGAGGVDASLNNYVALHYKSRHMSWLHCMWGVGASIGPYIMGYALNHDFKWNTGYLIISLIQFSITALLFFSLPLWKKNGNTVKTETTEVKKPLSLKEILSIPGAKAGMVAFFCYCALEQTSILWGASYMVEKFGITPEKVASLAGLFCLGITGGRAVSGFITMKLNDVQMIRMGQAIVIIGITCLLLPFGLTGSMVGLVLIGLGCAPIYPCVIHSTPLLFGADRSQAMIGVQMASAYAGTCIMPPLFGLIARGISARLLPIYLAAILLVMIFVRERLNRLVLNKKMKQEITPAPVEN